MRLNSIPTRSHSVFAMLLMSLFTLPLAAVAQAPDAPVVLDSGVSGCVPTTELCGDGIDQDCNGSDALCSGSDKDNDGFTTSADCDDSNRTIYPGILVGCSAAGGSGTRKCQGDATYTACSTTPVCEATSGRKCYYISALTGSDANPGTFTSPWKTYRNIVSYYSGVGQPSTWVQLQAGDVVYFMSGLYSDTYTYSGDTRAFFLRFVNGTSTAPITIKAYPGAHPVISPGVRSGGMYVLQSNWVVLDGFEVARSYGWGVRFADSNNVEVRNTWIHDTDGTDNDNIAGLYVNNTADLKAHHCLIHDNYDRTNADTGGNKTENSRNVVLFGGGNARLNHNVIFQTPLKTAAKTGGCITYKHSASIAGAVFEVDHSIFWNCFHPSIGSGTWNSRIHHNLIINSDPIEFRDFGGITHNENNLVEYNTMVGTQALNYHPTSQWGPIGTLTFRRNVIVDNSSSYNFEDAMITIHPYGSDALYNLVVPTGKISFSNNCYYNTPASLIFSLFGRNGDGYGTSGSVSTFSQWQGLGYDSGSLNANAQLDSSQVPGNASCSAMGWKATP